jgi:hypothetical protein
MKFREGNLLSLRCVEVVRATGSCKEADDIPASTADYEYVVLHKGIS